MSIDTDNGNNHTVADDHHDNRDPQRRTLLWIILQSLFRVMTTVMFDLKVRRIHYVPRRGGVLVLSNHQSFLDPILLASQLYRPVSFMARSGLFTNWIFGRAIRHLNAFPVRQGTGDMGAVRESIRRLRQGHMLVIYPEGSRSKDGELGPIASGAALIARRAGVPVIPAVIDGASAAWPPSRKLFRPAHIEVLYGPPMELDGLKAGQITELIDRTFRQMLVELKALKTPR
ncbi:MAG: 1-acyl-sn-glycerol-3-phosphate acyltransferase [Phycisphaerales bacterium]|nr:1-acyl-sn-glycerol-3-phosphate acyltransferase [Phycisphaerales bacterium]